MTSVYWTTYTGGTVMKATAQVMSIAPGPPVGIRARGHLRFEEGGLKTLQSIWS